MKYVMDSCALIAFIRDEEGADVVEQNQVHTLNSIKGFARGCIHQLNTWCC